MRALTPPVTHRFPGGASKRRPRINVSLTVELEELVSAQVASGMYHTASEVVREGFNCVDRGEYADYPVADLPALAQRIKARGLKRLAR